MFATIYRVFSTIDCLFDNWIYRKPGLPDATNFNYYPKVTVEKYYLHLFDQLYRYFVRHQQKRMYLNNQQSRYKIQQHTEIIPY
jgi:hypothetical protein